MGLHVSALATHMSLNFVKSSTTVDKSVFAESLSLVNFALDQNSNMERSDCCARAVGRGGWCQRETRGTDSQTWIVPWLHQLVLHTSSRLNFANCDSISDSSSSITLSALDATCFRMRCETRSRVITLTMSSMRFSEFSCGISCWISCGTSCGLHGIMGVRDSLLVDPASLWLSVGSERSCLWSISVSDLVAKLRRCFRRSALSTNRLRYHVSV